MVNETNVSLTTTPPPNYIIQGNTTHGKKGLEEDNDTNVIFFIFVSCALGALVRRLIQGLKLPLPYTVILLVLGILLGLLSGRYEAVHAYAAVVEADPHLILHIFLPILIFESAFAMEIHTFLKTFLQVVLLAIPGLALAALLTCIMARYMFTYDWNWNEGMMFGSILSATDPVAVVALLRDIGASKQLAMVIEGESLLNDGAAIVFFEVFLKLTTSTEAFAGDDIVIYFLQVAIGGPLFGFLMAKITLFWLSKIFNDALAEITITLASTYLTYYIGEELLHLSGVLAVVVLGVTMSAERTMISPEVETFLHRFWETLAYIANTLIFIIVGMVIAEKAIFEIHGIDWFYMFALYFGLFVIRGLVIGIFSPVLRHTGYGMTWRDGIVMTWGGLRGAVGLALALKVAHHDEIDQEKVGLRVLIHVSGIVFLTLLINASTILGLLKVLGMSDISPAKKVGMANAVKYLQDMRERTLNMLKTDRFLADADWDTVEKSCDLEDPYKTTEEDAELDESLDIRSNAVCPECDTKLPIQYTRKELCDMTNEAILRMLKAEKMSYWRQFEQGMLSREATRKLQECTEVAADKKGKFIDSDEIKKSWMIPTIYAKLKPIVKKLVGRSDTEPPPEGTLHHHIFRITRHKAFHITLYILIALDMVNVTLAVISEFIDVMYSNRNIFRGINVIFVCIYIINVALKMVLYKKKYLKSIWHVLCIMVIMIGTIDVILSYVLPFRYDDSTKVIYITLLAFIIGRSIRLFLLVEAIMPSILNLIKWRISQQLSYGYDVGRGYVAGEEEVRKLVDHMCGHKDISKSLKQVSDNGRLDVIRCLGMLQKQHPDIALSIKTRQAIRSVLNNLRDGIHELLLDGILDESEGQKLEHMVEARMKRLLSAPPSLPLPPPDKMLNNVCWLRNDPELIEYIKSKAKLLSFNYEDVIIHEGDPPGGIYIIVSGMVRLESTTQPGKPIIMESKLSASRLKIKANLIDFLTAGNILGEMGMLTRKPRSATVQCETAVQLLFISLEDMEMAIHKFSNRQPPLFYRLWHVCANRIATGLLMKQAAYQGWTKEKVKLRLENSYIAQLDEADIFTIDSSISDVILVNGHAQNAFTHDKFQGPCYIPWTVLKLEALTELDPKPVILVVPSELGQPTHSSHKSSHDMGGNGHGAFIASISRLCLKHASEQRNNVSSKWGKIQQAKSLGTLFQKVRRSSAESESPGASTSGQAGSANAARVAIRASMPGFIESRKPILDNEGADNPNFDSSGESLDTPDKEDSVDDHVFEPSTSSEENKNSLSNYRPSILKSFSCPPTTKVDDQFLSSLGGGMGGTDSLSNIAVKSKDDCEECSPNNDHDDHDDDDTSGKDATHARNVLRSLIHLKENSSHLVAITEESDQKDTHL
ncbi:hypothetical protein ScPMuIL_015476 [Solemya velum]